MTRPFKSLALAAPVAAVSFVAVICSGGMGCGSGEASQGGQRGGPTKNRPVTVSVESVKVGPIRVRLEFVGEVRARRSVEIAAPAAGKLKSVLVDMGQRVEAGEVLAELDAATVRAKLAEARASLSVSRAAIRRAEAEFRSVDSELARKAPLAEDNLVTPQEMDQLQSRHDASKANLEVSRAQVTQAEAAIQVLSQALVDTRLVAPFGGRIEARLLDPGAVVNAGTPVLRLVHTNPAVVSFQVSEQQVGRLRARMAESEDKGVPVRLALSAYPDKRWTGKLVRIAPALDSRTRAAAAEAEFENEGNELMPGMYCRLSIDLGGREKALLVPLRAVVKRRIQTKATGQPTTPEQAAAARSGQGVFVVRDDTAHLVPVVLGVEQSRYGEVLEGLNEGDAVVVEGQNALRDGATVKLVSPRGRSKAR